MSTNQKLRGLSIKVGPLGENDRLLTLLSETQGVIRLAIPGGRKPTSKLIATSPLNFLELHVVGKKDLKKATQIKVIKSYANLGKSIEKLSGAHAITELILILFGNNEPQTEILNTVLTHLNRLDNPKSKGSISLSSLAITVQSYIHLLALGGYSIPVQTCCRTGTNLNPPIGKWDWRCSLIPDEGIAIGNIYNSFIQLNPSELALLQRLFQDNLPIANNGEIMGPTIVWLKLLSIIECWIEANLSKKILSFQLLKEVVGNNI